MDPINLRMRCLCGTASGLYSARRLDNSSPRRDLSDLSLCHCDSCRHSSGVLCASYYPVDPPDRVQMGLSKYRAKDGFTRYFCSRCGCHVLRCKTTEYGYEIDWELATGVVIETLGELPSRFVKHDHVSDTKGGGMAVWIPEFDGCKMETPGFHEAPNKVSSSSEVQQHQQHQQQQHLQASCACGQVSFHITRPNGASSLPKSNISDLLSPYKTTDPAVTKNPSDEKWWLRAGATKYLAGTCACRSCRLVTGFEIQTWAFVPRANIVFHVKDEYGLDDDTPLDFNKLPEGILGSYCSSPDVLREFCGNCGATVFWHDKWRPDLIDVSVGLLRAQEGARAESWLDWWTKRVSFTEEAEVGRQGDEAKKARALISSLERGLSSWGHEN